MDSHSLKHERKQDKYAKSNKINFAVTLTYVTKATFAYQLDFVCSVTSVLSLFNPLVERCNLSLSFNMRQKMSGT